MYEPATQTETYLHEGGITELEIQRQERAPIIPQQSRYQRAARTLRRIFRREQGQNQLEQSLQTTQ